MKRCLLGLVCLFVSIYSFGQTLESDRLALVALYNQGNGSNWGSNWVIPGNTGDSPCGWDGVTCAGGRVTRLSIMNTGAGGIIPQEIGNLTELIHLDLANGYMGFGFSGSIPSEISNLSKLEYLNILGNGFNPLGLSAIGSLTSLKELHMSTYGDVPASFANLVNLEKCIMGRFGPLDGIGQIAFPNVVCQWPKIKVLRMGGVLFTTQIPSQIGNLTTLDTLELTGASPYESSVIANGGNIPSEIGNLVNLKSLVISYNGFTGSIPASFNNLTNLTRLDLSHNMLTGPIPNILGIPVTASVDISNNLFNLAGMVDNRTVLDVYAPQGAIPMNVFDDTIAWFTMINAVHGLSDAASNTYKFFKDGSEVSGASNDGYLIVNYEQRGKYRIEVRNSLLPALVLSTEEKLVEPPLPVTLVSFNGKSESNQTKLTWKTTSETNNKGFEIERSADARTFEKIGFVDGSGDTKENQFYHFTDLSPLAKSYYRLKQLDYDGQFEYSSVIVVKGDGAIVKIYPNPAQEYLTISGIAQKQPFSITDQNGRVVLEGQIADKGQVNIKNLTPGRYVVRVGEESSRLLIHR